MNGYYNCYNVYNYVWNGYNYIPVASMYPHAANPIVTDQIFQPVDASRISECSSSRKNPIVIQEDIPVSRGEESIGDIHPSANYFKKYLEELQSKNIEGVTGLGGNRTTWSKRQIAILIEECTKVRAGGRRNFNEAAIKVNSVAESEYEKHTVNACRLKYAKLRNKVKLLENGSSKESPKVIQEDIPLSRVEEPVEMIQSSTDNELQTYLAQIQKESFVKRSRKQPKRSLWNSQQLAILIEECIKGDALGRWSYRDIAKKVNLFAEKECEKHSEKACKAKYNSLKFDVKLKKVLDPLGKLHLEELDALKNKPLNQEELEYLIDSLAKGMNLSDVALKLGRSQNLCSRAVKNSQIKQVTEQATIPEISFKNIDGIPEVDTSNDQLSDHLFDPTIIAPL